MFKRCILSLILLLAWSSSAKETITVTSTQWYPYFYQENGQLKGSLLDFSREVIETANYTFNPVISIWARAQHNVTHNTNWMLVGLSRTPWRENNFFWIGRTSKLVNIYFYGINKSSKDFDAVEKFKNSRIGVVNGSYYHEYTLKEQFPAESILPVSRRAQLLKLLLKGRIDFMLMNEREFKEEVKAHGVNNITIHPTPLFLAFSAADYLAVGKNTSALTVTKLQKSYAQVIKANPNIIK